MKKEWNISYAMHDGMGGLNEFMVVLPSWWKVILWLFRRGRRCRCGREDAGDGVRTPEDNCRYMYDYQVCCTYDELEQTLFSIGAEGCVLVCVTQGPKGAFTVFFRRCLGG